MDDPTLRLEQRLQQLPTIHSTRSAASVLREARSRRTQRGRGVAVAAVVALAAAALLALLSPPGEQRARGGAGIAPPVSLAAAAEGPLGVRPLATGERLQRDESVVFRITTGGRGLLTLARSDGTPIWPTDGGPWRVEAGQHFLGDATPLAWTPDAGPHGTHSLIATLCPEGAPAPQRCTSSAFTVRWDP